MHGAGVSRDKTSLTPLSPLPTVETNSSSARSQISLHNDTSAVALQAIFSEVGDNIIQPSGFPTPTRSLDQLHQKHNAASSLLGQQDPDNIARSPHLSQDRLTDRASLVQDQQQQYPVFASPDGLDPTAQGSYFEIGSINSASSLSPGNAPFQWYNLVAQDAINSIQKNNIAASDPRWNFDDWVPSRRPSHDRGQLGQDNSKTQAQATFTSGEGFDTEAWRLVCDIKFESHELEYFQYYVQVIGPILDLFDRSRQFTEVVPRLALRNFGLAKSMLAVAARYRSLQRGSSHSSEDDRSFATQFFYETLNYLAQAIQHPTYTKGTEILATAIMISTYEMFDGSNREWERHLKGAFWIQRFQDNDGESEGLRQAVWWAWLRQDIWAAFRDGRKTLTMWAPKKPLVSLSADELALRILYIVAKVVEYASPEAARGQSWQVRIEQGERLEQDLESWHAALPESYKPLPGHGYWVNPPSYASALQYYNFAKIMLLLNKPSLGGVGDYRSRQVVVNKTIDNVFGIIWAQPQSLEAAFVNFQALYVAGLCVQASQQEVLAELLESTLENTRYPSTTLVEDLRRTWERAT